MTLDVNFGSPYQLGGSLPATAPTYVCRQSDFDLYDALLAGDYCYVLNARQMGKSSLRIRTMMKLQAEGIACAEIELSGIGSQEITARQWYGGLIQELVSGFDLPLNRRRWLEERNDLSPIQCLGEFIDTVLLSYIHSPIVIFIDEIDSVLSLSFPTDEFFALIRHCYEQRATHPKYRRLTFVFLGVGTPSDLIQDPNATPFNIGHAIELKGFQRAESKALAQGLEGFVRDPHAVLSAILDWTEGQPFLTQKLCWLVTRGVTLHPTHLAKDAAPPGHRTHVAARRTPHTAFDVDGIVRTQVIENWESHDEPEHLRTIRDRILRNAESTERLLKLYRRVLRHGHVPVTLDRDQLDLRLSGLVEQRQGKLVVKNPIYRAVFDLAWAEQELAALQPNVTRLPVWAVAITSVIIATGVMGMRTLGMLQSIELPAFDQLMRQRPLETMDPRLLIVGADETDIGPGQYGHPIPDGILAQLVAKLNQYRPQVIGLDIVRDQPVPPGHADLVAQLQQRNVITGCTFGQPPGQNIQPPPPSAATNVGFFDLFNDVAYQAPNYVVRRYLLSRTTDPTAAQSLACETPYSFGFQLASRYLSANGREIRTRANNWQLGGVMVHRLSQRSGGYQTLDPRGNQLLLNYRNTPNPHQIAQQVTVRDVLAGTSNFDPAWVQGRVVLIGVTASSIPDPHDTPYGPMRGLYIHAHVVSQLLSAVETRNRPLLWWWPVWADALWIWIWAACGAIVGAYLRMPLYQWLGLGLAVLSIYGLCWWGLTQAGWLPLIPAVLALGLTAGALALLRYWHRKHQE